MAQKGAVQWAEPYMRKGRPRCAYVPDQERFCYKLLENDEFEPTFSSIQVRGYTNQTTRTEVLSTDNHRSARMRVVNRREYLWGGRNQIYDDLVDYRCRISGARMRCDQRWSTTIDGQLWCVMVGHIEFVRTSPE